MVSWNDRGFVARHLSASSASAREVTRSIEVYNGLESYKHVSVSEADGAPWM